MSSRRWNNPYRRGGSERRQPESGIPPAPEPLPGPRPEPDPAPLDVSILKQPFLRDTRVTSPVNTLKETLSKTVREMDFVDPSVLRQISPRVASLSVKDLNDLATEFAGLETNNPNIKELSIEEIQDIEGVFFELKSNSLGRLGQGDLASVDVSCCCCTPCCCCAAAVVDPF